MSTRAQPLSSSLERRFPLLALLNPGRLARPSAIALGIGLAAGWAAHVFAGLPLWAVTAIVLLALLPVGVLKWREDHRRYGATVMLLSMVLITQGVHTIEHIVQWAQYYLLLLPARQSTGLLSPANAEWVHFVWNWGVLLVVLALMAGGMRNRWAWLLLAVTVAHAVEHTYTFVRYQQVLAELRALNVFSVTAQGLPGIVGRDGWLARSPLTQNTFLCTLPGITTAMRLDVHFWWNVIETSLLLMAGAVFLRGRLFKNR
ncbi:MAG TPA: hypothetical protein VNL77_05075 [Roseiflexaceae bacterium]|nr:hypothetical protein [Roseiflexaceae bacterium]